MHSWKKSRLAETSTADSTAANPLDAQFDYGVGGWISAFQAALHALLARSYRATVLP